MTAQRNRNVIGIDPVNDVYQIQITGDPTTGAGCVAGVGSIALRTDSPGAGPGGNVYVKTGAAATAWTLIQAGVTPSNATSQNSSTAVTVDFSTGDTQQITLNGVTPVITLTNFVAGRRYTLELLQDGTGSRIPSYSPALKGTAVTLTTTAGKRDIIRLYADTLGNLVIEGSVLNL